MVKRICPLCVGAKRKRGLGMLYQDCPECEGKGLLHVDEPAKIVAVVFEDAEHIEPVAMPSIVPVKKEKKRKKG